MITHSRFLTAVLCLVFGLGCLTAVSAQSPEAADLQSHFSKAVEYQKKGKLDLAAKEYRYILKVRPDIEPVLMNLGIIYIQQHQLTGAETLFRHVLKVNPKNAQAAQSLGRVMSAEKRDGEAVK